jgi:hypothetical protein
MEISSANERYPFDGTEREHLWQSESAEQAYRTPQAKLVRHHHYHLLHHSHHLPDLALEHHHLDHHWHPHLRSEIHRSFAPNHSEGQSFRARGEHSRQGYEAPTTQVSSEQKAQMAAIVVQHAKEIGLSRKGTVAAVAAMLQESGADPNKPGDFDKHHHPRSFGLFMLNFHGGEGTENGLTPAQALNPHINAAVALKYFKEHDDPSISAAYLAKLAQRPSDPFYMSHINSLMGEAERLVRNS